jgi:hypothetical protein
MFDYPSILLILSFILMFISGYFATLIQQEGPPYQSVPMIFSGIVIWFPISVHFSNMGILSHFLHLHYSILRDKIVRGESILGLILIYIISCWMTKKHIKSKEA